MNNTLDTIMMFSEYDDVVSVEDVQQMLHIGRSAVYKLLNEEKIKNVRIGKRFIIPKRRSQSVV